MSIAAMSVAEASLATQASTAPATAKPPKRRQTAALPDQIQAPEAR